MEVTFKLVIVHIIPICSTKRKNLRLLKETQKVILLLYRYQSLIGLIIIKPKTNQTHINTQRKQTKSLGTKIKVLNAFPFVVRRAKHI